jgi:1-deoxy-D-xylulose-5-phosphate synthase
MQTGVGLSNFAAKYKERSFDVGIAEGHAVAMSAGLSRAGMRPVCAIYSTFLQRAYDMLIHDVAISKEHVVFGVDRAGLVGEDGATHHGCYDMSIYRSIPGTVIAAPKDELELKNMMYSAMLADGGPYIIRYPRGYGEGVEWRSTQAEDLQVGRGEQLVNGTKVAVIAAGPVANRAVEAAREIMAQTGWTPSIYNIRYIKPIDQVLLSEVYNHYERIVTIEDGTVLGGLYGAVAEYMSAQQTPKPVRAVGIPDRYISQGTQKELHAECGLTTEEIKKVIAEEIQKNEKKD